MSKTPASWPAPDAFPFFTSPRGRRMIFFRQSPRDPSDEHVENCSPSIFCSSITHNLYFRANTTGQCRTWCWTQPDRWVGSDLEITTFRSRLCTERRRSAVWFYLSEWRASKREKYILHNPFLLRRYGSQSFVREHLTKQIYMPTWKLVLFNGTSIQRIRN